MRLGRKWVAVTWLAIMIVMLLAAPRLLPTFWLSVLTEGLILALAAAALDVMVGYAGMVSLGQAAFFGAAGYGVGFAITDFGWNPWVAAAFGVVVATAVGLSFGALAVRTRGLYFLVITLAFAQVLWGLAVKWTPVTGGYNGIPGIRRPELPFVSLSPTSNYYYAVVIVVVFCLLVLHAFVRSPVGLTLEGIRSNEPRLQVLGYRTVWYRWGVFGVAAAFGGVAGVMNAFFSRFVSPSSLFWTLSALLLLIVILGGVGTLWGAAVAGVGLTIVRAIVSDISGRWTTVLGVLFVVTVLVASGGWFRFAQGLFGRLRNALASETAG